MKKEMKSRLLPGDKLELFKELYLKGVIYEVMGRKLGLEKKQVQGLATRFVKQGYLPRRRAKNTDKYLKLSKEELLDLVNKYRSRDKAPNALVYAVNKNFGSWTNATLEAFGEINLGGFDPNKLTTIYYLDFGEFVKIGITQQNLENRISKFPKHEVLDFDTMDYISAKEMEKEIHGKLKVYPNQLLPSVWDRNGKTECFYKPDNCLDLASLEFL